MIYLNTDIEEENLHLLYPDKYYKKAGNIAAILGKFFLNERRKVVERFKKIGMILDIGCGDGEFLKVMVDRGWQASGIDISDGAKKSLVKKKSINVYHKDLREIRLQDESFDVVTLWQVLEHLDKPGNYLAEINRILKRDGVLVISIPNIDSFQSRFSGNKWFHLDLPRHQCHFTPRTISKLMNDSKFLIKEINHSSIEYNPVGWWQSFFNLLGCEINFAYKYLKRGGIEKSVSILKRTYTILCLVLFCIPFLPLAFLLSFIESILQRGGIITIVATKSK